MAHDKVFGIYENKCLEEVLPAANFVKIRVTFESDISNGKYIHTEVVSYPDGFNKDNTFIMAKISINGIGYRTPTTFTYANSDDYLACTMLITDQGINISYVHDPAIKIDLHESVILELLFIKEPFVGVLEEPVTPPED